MKKTPTWFKVFISFALGCLILSLFVFLNSENSYATVENQIKTLRKGKFTQAYYEYTSKEFQKTNSLNQFKEFLRSFPSLTTNGETHLSPGLSSNEIIVSITTDDHNSLFNFELVKEDNGWKIVNVKGFNKH